MLSKDRTLCQRVVFSNVLLKADLGDGFSAFSNFNLSCFKEHELLTSQLMLSRGQMLYDQSRLFGLGKLLTADRKILT